MTRTRRARGASTIPVVLYLVLTALPAAAQVFNWNDDRDTTLERLQALINQMNEGNHAIGAAGPDEVKVTIWAGWGAGFGTPRP
jgi:hypothetical protein